MAAFLAMGGRRRLLDRQDCLQEVLAHWWTARKTYRSDWGANPRTYIKRVVHSAGGCGGQPDRGYRNHGRVE